MESILLRLQLHSCLSARTTTSSTATTWQSICIKTPKQNFISKADFYPTRAICLFLLRSWYIFFCNDFELFSPILSYRWFHGYSLCICRTWREWDHVSCLNSTPIHSQQPSATSSKEVHWKWHRDCSIPGAWGTPLHSKYEVPIPACFHHCESAQPTFR